MTAATRNAKTHRYGRFGQRRNEKAEPGFRRRAPTGSARFGAIVGAVAAGTLGLQAAPAEASHVHHFCPWQTADAGKKGPYVYWLYNPYYPPGDAPWTCIRYQNGYKTNLDVVATHRSDQTSGICAGVIVSNDDFRHFSSTSAVFGHVCGPGSWSRASCFSVCQYHEGYPFIHNPGNAKSGSKYSGSWEYSS